MQLARLVVDLDGTLCHSTGGQYAAARPILEHVNAINSLFDEGHYIHIFTARGMNTFRGSRVLAEIRWRRLTQQQLDAWSVRYHKLTLGKPSADFYIDDKGLSAKDFFENVKNLSLGHQST